MSENKPPSFALHRATGTVQTGGTGGGHYRTAMEQDRDPRAPPSARSGQQQPRLRLPNNSLLAALALSGPSSLDQFRGDFMGASSSSTGTTPYTYPRMIACTTIRASPRQHSNTTPTPTSQRSLLLEVLDEAILLADTDFDAIPTRNPSGQRRGPDWDGRQ